MRPDRVQAGAPKTGRALLLLLALFLCSAFSAGAQEEDEPDALAAYRSGDFEEAVEITLQEIEAMPRNMDSYTVLGWSLNALGRYQDALEYGRQALEISRYDHRVIQVMAEAHFRLENNMESLNFLEEYVAIAPEGRLIHQVYYLMGEIFMRFGEYHHADAALTAALYYEDNSANWWARLGLARERAGSLDLAVQAYEQALQRNGSLEAAQQGISRIEEQLAG